QLGADLAKYYAEDPHFRVCIVSQSSTKVGLETELKERFPHLKIRRLIGSDSGKTERQALEDINETLEDVNVFLYSPVIESGVDITVNVKKVYGLLSSSSNSQRAFLHSERTLPGVPSRGQTPGTRRWYRRGTTCCEPYRPSRSSPAYSFVRTSF
ncbi:MAG: hypothetical protein ACKPKO_24030, partial [Candidatus Fonsibacter sp.]